MVDQSSEDGKEALICVKVEGIRSKRNSKKSGTEGSTNSDRVVYSAVYPVHTNDGQTCIRVCKLNGGLLEQVFGTLGLWRLFGGIPKFSTNSFIYLHAQWIFNKQDLIFRKYIDGLEPNRSVVLELFFNFKIGLSAIYLVPFRECSVKPQYGTKLLFLNRI